MTHARWLVWLHRIARNYLPVLGLLYVIFFLHFNFRVTPRDVYQKIAALEVKVNNLESATDDRYTFTQAALREYFFATELERLNPELKVPLTPEINKKMGHIIKELEAASKEEQK
jgi:hypothetical protein